MRGRVGRGGGRDLPWLGDALRRVRGQWAWARAAREDDGGVLGSLGLQGVHALGA